MNKIYGHPGPWHFYVNRNDNIGLSINEIKQKYLKEQLMFESDMLYQLNNSTTSNAPALSAAGGKGRGQRAAVLKSIILKLNPSNYSPQSGPLFSEQNPWPVVDEQVTLFGLPSSIGWSGRVASRDWEWGTITVDWGDGSTESYSDYNITLTETTQNNVYKGINHTYSSPGEYTVTITGETPYFFNAMFLPLTEFVQFTPSEISTTSDWRGFFSGFPPSSSWGGTNGIDTWDMSFLTSTKDLFSLSQIASVPKWGAVWDYNGTINRDISNWNTSNVTDMSFTFATSTRATVTAERNSFNQLLNWNTSNVTNMRWMFYYANGFNNSGSSSGGVCNFDTSNVTDFSYMFAGSALQVYNDTGVGLPAVPNWDLSSATNVSGFYYYATITLENVRNTLIGWADNPNTADNVYAGSFGYLLGPTFSSDATVVSGSDAHVALLTLQGKGWTFTDVNVV